MLMPRKPLMILLLFLAAIDWGTADRERLSLFSLTWLFLGVTGIVSMFEED
jgi:hypothetical protein